MHTLDRRADEKSWHLTRAVRGKKGLDGHRLVHRDDADSTSLEKHDLRRVRRDGDVCRGDDRRRPEVRRGYRRLARHRKYLVHARKVLVHLFDPADVQLSRLIPTEFR